MKLDEFRRLLLNPNSGTAPEMAPPPQILTQPKTKASRVQSKSPNVAKVVVKSPKEYKTTSVITKSKQTASSNSVPENRPKSKEKSVERTIETEDPKPKSCWSLRYYLELPSIWCNKVLNTCQLIIYFPYNLLCWCIAKIYVVIYDTYLLQVIIFVSGLYLSSAISMTYPIFALCRLVLGTLYPAYASYKAVRTKNVREYVKWMMYWIVFAIFTSIETFADIFVAFWFPFYYEMKILVLLWLISPVSKGSLGSSIIYRKFVHPALMKREEEIDHMILRLQEQGYNTVSRLAGRAFRTVSDFVMQTAIRSAPRLDQLLYDNVDARDPRHLQQDGGFMWNILNDPQTRNPNPNHVAQAVVQAGARGDTASDFLENVDEIDHMDFVPEADKKRGRSPRKAANKVAVPQSSVFSSDSEAGPSETPASSDMDVELDPNVTMAVKRRGRPSKKKESSTDAEINEKKPKRVPKKKTK